MITTLRSHIGIADAESVEQSGVGCCSFSASEDFLNRRRVSFALLIAPYALLFVTFCDRGKFFCIIFREVWRKLFCQFVMQPQFSNRPVAFDGGSRDFQNFCRFLQSQIGEEFEFDDASLPRVHFAESV